MGIFSQSCKLAKLVPPEESQTTRNKRPDNGSKRCESALNMPLYLLLLHNNMFDQNAGGMHCTGVNNGGNDKTNRFTEHYTI